MKKLFTFLSLACLMLGSSKIWGQTVCNSSGNLIIYSNYEGGIININVNANIPNLKIGICSYESASVVISGAFAGNVTQVVYAGGNTLDDSCLDGIPTTTIVGVSAAITTISVYPSVGAYNPVHGNGSNIIACGYGCDTTSNAGGCNTPDELVYYFSQVTGGTLRSHYTSYGCWTGTTFSVSNGGNCCISTAVSPTCSVPPTPVSITPTANLNICAGNSTTISVTSTTTVNWYSSSTSTVPIATGSVFVITPTITSGTFPLFAGATNTCSSSPKLNLSITVKPVPNISLFANTSIVCASQSLALIANSSVNSYSWSNGFNSASIIISPTTNTVYSVSTTNSVNCTATVSKSITVASVASITSVSSNTNLLCGSGGTINFTGVSSPTQTISWYNAAVGGTLLGTSNSGAPFNFNVNSTTTLYAQATSTVIKDNYFNHTGTVQTFVLPQTASNLTLSVWGAEGGGRRISGNSSSGLGGKGGYASGQTTIVPSSTLNIFVGGHGLSTTTGTALGGFNGGGQGHASTSSEPGNGGGGATDIRLNGLLFTDRIIVAGGGGGGGEDSGDLYGHGGGLTGVGYNATYDASQTTAGTGGGLGFGGGTGSGDGGGGGGGYYGGGTLFSTTVGTDTQGGGGGSGFVGTLTATTLINGSLSMPDPNGGTMIGNINHGLAYIKYLGECSSTRSPITVTVTSPPVISASTSQSLICIGQTSSITASGSSSYSWSPGGLTGSLVSVSPSVVTTYTVIGGTGSCTNSAVQTISVNSSPTVAISSSQSVCAGSFAVVTLTTSSTGNTFTWSPGNSNNSSIIVSNPTATAVYSVNATGPNGCKTLATTTISVVNCTGLSSISNVKLIEVYPNPASLYLTVKTSQDIIFKILEITGKIISTKELKTGINKIDISDFKAGIYIIETTDIYNNISTKKLVIEK